MMNILNVKPWAAEGTFVAPNATVVGEVYLNVKSSVMYGAVLRGTDQHV